MRAKQRKVLVTGGPTRAYLDDVRFLTNISSGALAYEICRALTEAGFQVSAVIGPTSFPFEKLEIQYFPVETNDEMLSEILRICRRQRPDVAIFSAAVLDFVPDQRTKGKVSSKKKEWVLRLKPSRKMIDEVGKKFPSIRRVGFKLESQLRSGKSRDAWAERILRTKGLRALVVNYLSEVSGKKHMAYLYRPSAPTKVLPSKAAIAQALTKLVSE